MPHEFQLNPQQEEVVRRRKILGEVTQKMAEAETQKEKDFWNEKLSILSLLSSEEAAPSLEEMKEHLRDQNRTYSSRKGAEEKE
ncbi:MAG: hypothetical protein KBD52_01915 [Candidatus Pacebacteria bacterium]|nr:hypothetical protein [Candidatus Paceibacterota bacterium]